MHQTISLCQYLRICELDAALTARWDGEDAGLKRAATYIFQQRRIALLAHDLFVDGACLVSPQQLTFQLTAIHPHIEAGDRSIFGQREDIGALDRVAGLIDKNLVDAGGGHLIDNLNGDAVILDRQGNVTPRDRMIDRWVWDDDAVGRDRRGAGDDGGKG